MSEEYERTTITGAPERVIEVRRSGSAGWWIAALVAVVALVAVIFLFAGNNPTQSQLDAARDQGVNEANIANATAGAQQAASVAAQAAQDAASAGAKATESAAQTAAEQSRAAADAAADSARDAADIVTGEPPR